MECKKLRIGGLLLFSNTNLKHVEIPEGIERLGKSSFFDKRGIISVTFPSTLKEIESRAFRNCISLKRVEFCRDGVAVWEDAFQNCSALQEVCMPTGVVYGIEGIGEIEVTQCFDAAGISYGIEGIGGLSGGEVPLLVRTVRRQVLGNSFRIA